MPNLKEHLAISGVTSTGTYLLMCNYYDRKPNVWELLVCAGMGLVAGAAPDIFESARHPNHRAFGHSLTLGAGLAKFAFTHCRKENDSWEEFRKILFAVVIVSYLAHLLADAFTPRCLPVV